MNENGLSAADIAAVTDNNRGFNGYGYPMPVMPMYGGYGNSFGGGFGGDGSWLWLIIILALFGGWGNNGNGGFGNGFNNDYAWLSNGQKEIMQNTNNGFNTLQLANQLTAINSGVQNLSTELCNCCANMTNTVNAGFANAETAANARQMANMQQAFNNQLSTVQGFNNLGTQLCEDAGENRLAIAGLNSTILSENCADRYEAAKNTRDIIDAVTANSQKIINELFRDRLDEKDDKIAELNRQLTMADLRASQVQQTANIVDSTYARLRDCPIDSTPIYGRQPIFTCPNNNNNGCGCGNSFGSTIV